MDCKEYYEDIQKRLAANVTHTLESRYLPQIASSQSFVDDYSIWINWIDQRYDNDLFALALLEYETATVFCLQSLYKQAFTALRACLEHTLFGIHLSTNLYQYLQWKNESYDVYWSNITDPDSGLYSKTFASVFCPELLNHIHLIGTMAKSLYRECSEYVHGNYRVLNTFSEQLEYIDVKTKTFYEKLENLRYIIEFSLFVRFNRELGHEGIIDLEAQIMEYMGHLQEISMFVSMAKETNNG